MKRLFTLIGIAMVLGSHAQDQYTKGMQKAMGLWQEDKIIEASNLFERIAMAEDDNWIPYYYVAQVNTTSSFGVKDEALLTQRLEKAKEALDISKRLSPDNPELIVQEAMINTAWLAYDAATYGMTLSAKNSQLYAMAMKLAPDNPRVVYSKANWDMGSARYFGKDTTPYCKDVEKALELFATFTNDTPFYPNWGEERAKRTLEECK
ncbi:MAG: hypothetical protein AAGF77_08505 [Bacteroidota bacterium]